MTSLCTEITESLEGAMIAHIAVLDGKTSTISNKYAISLIFVI